MSLNTTNLISTPNIEGNIGQCTSNINWLTGASRKNVFIEYDKAWITNSCTGITETTQTWEFTDFAVGCMWVSGLLITACLGVFIYKFLKNNQHD